MILINKSKTVLKFCVIPLYHFLFNAIKYFGHNAEENKLADRPPVLFPYTNLKCMR